MLSHVVKAKIIIKSKKVLKIVRSNKLGLVLWPDRSKLGYGYTEAAVYWKKDK